MTTTILDRFKLRGGSAAALANLNEIPLRREMIVELDNVFTTGEFKAKIGDGVTHYNDLPYLATGGSVTISDVAPASPEPGQTWVDSTNGTEYVYYDDGDTQQWVEFGPVVPSYGMLVGGGTGTATSATQVVDSAIMMKAATSGSLTFTTPAQAGDMIVVFGFGDYGVDTTSPGLAGFTQIFVDSAPNHVIRTFAKVAAGGESTIALTTNAAASKICAGGVILRGSGAKLLAIANSSTHTSTVANPITIPVPNVVGARKFICVVGGRKDGSAVYPISVTRGTILKATGITGYGAALVLMSEADVDAMTSLFSPSGPGSSATFSVANSPLYALNTNYAFN